MASRVAILLLWGLATACGGGNANQSANNAPEADPCNDFELDVKKVWSDDTKIKVNASIMDHWGGQLGADIAKQRAESVSTSMDHIAQDWVMLRRSACLDHFKRKLGSDAEYQARVDCFNRVLERQRSALTELDKNVDAGVSAANALTTELNSCR